MTVPRTNAGIIDLDAFVKHLQFLLGQGIRGFALNGATGEYCLTTPVELAAILRKAREVAGEEVTLLAGVGGASVSEVLHRLTTAHESGANAILLPMPYFFPYNQQDLDAFVREIAAHSPLPLLLYDLPTFTSPLHTATALALIEQLEPVAGIKDSSGSLETVRQMKAHVGQANRVIGNDSALHAALAESVCDGVVSGVACVLPELMQALYRAAENDPDGEQALALKKHLDAFIEWLGRFPVPWGLKIIAEERNLIVADFPLPLSPERLASRAEFVQWFQLNKADLLVSE